ncbi:DUF2202 domain-containing protein [bacterium]|nr:DUF2202 domain-containing protein [candidate division CSSED10-310 bacterium]
MGGMMKKMVRIGMVLALAGSAAAPLLHAADQQVQPVDQSKQSPPARRSRAVAGHELTAEEREALLYMRQEEKVAADVYAELAAAWKSPLFNNILRSETRHKEALKILLDKHGLEDPIAGLEPGKFSDRALSKVYKKAVERGRKSLVEGLQAGAGIEELDILDLRRLLPKVSNKELSNTFQQLRRASANHLRAFVRMLARHGVTYEPQHMDKHDFDSLMSEAGPQRTGRTGGPSRDRAEPVRSQN